MQINGLELRNRDESRRFLLHGLWLQRLSRPAPAHYRPVLEWALELASEDHPLPPLGLVADVGLLTFRREPARRPEPWPIPGMPAGLMRAYEDQVLGKFYADTTFERAGDAIRRCQPGRERARGLAFLLAQFHRRAGFAGVTLSPAWIKALLDAPAEETLAQAWQELAAGQMHPLLPPLYESLIAGCRATGSILAAEDLFELEHGTALAEMGQRVALRQVLQAAQRLEAGLPRRRPQRRAPQRQVPTRLTDEDIYPVGGYASLSNRGTIESMLHSQLAHMEKDERPDLFDVKYLRDELLYYSRDENQFRRRRLTFIFALYPDLVQTRFKDSELPWQRGVLLLALLRVAVRKLSAWLGNEALRFEFLFLAAGEGRTLDREQEVLRTLERELLANGTVLIRQIPTADLAGHMRTAQQRSQCHFLFISAQAASPALGETKPLWLQIGGAIPAIHGIGAREADDPVAAWSKTLAALLEAWIR